MQAVVPPGRRENGLVNGAGRLLIELYPSRHWDLEFWPAWATINDSRLQDYDLSAHFLLKFVGVKVGYRWLRSPNTDISGPTIGVVTRF